MHAKSLTKAVVHVLLCLITGLLLVNALCVLYNEWLYGGRAPVNSSSKVCQCQPCSAAKDGHNPTFTPIDHFVPPGQSTLGPLGSRDTLTRVANELSFDHSSCPSDSTMFSSAWRHTEPVHSSCPAVFIVGARKGGTTSLYQYLSLHPHFEGMRFGEGSAKSGETFHFSARYDTEQWRTYMSIFPKQDIMTGDASVGNLVNCKVPKRIFVSCGNFSKIIIMLRDPIDRYVSNFMMRAVLQTAHYNNHSEISTAIKMDVQYYIDNLVSSGIDIVTGMGENGLASNWAKLRCLFGPSTNMVYEGLYYIHVLNWICNYPSENILFVNSEEFFDQTSNILKEVYQFLGLDILSDSRRKAITSFVYNKGIQPSLKNQQLKDTDRKKLRTIYRSFNNEIQKLLKWNENWT